MAMAIAVFAIGVPVSLLLVRRLPSDVGQSVDGRSATAEARSTNLARSAEAEVQWTTREALHTPTFWILVIALMVMLGILAFAIYRAGLRAGVVEPLGRA